MERHSVKKEISLTALITTIVLLIVLVASAVIVCFCFPYSGYTVTSDLGLKKASLFFAERYAEKGNIDGLVYCVELEDKFMEDNPNKYAKKLITHTEEFFEYDNYESYFNQLDEYYIKNSQPALRIGLYSYYSYVVSRNYKARKALGKADEIIFRGKVTQLGSVFKYVGEYGLEIDNGLTIEEKAVLYNALGGVLDSSYKSVLEQNDYKFFYELTASIPSFIVTLEYLKDQLKTLYLMHSVLYIIEQMNNFLDENNVRIPALVREQWQSFTTEFTYNGESLQTAYTDLFVDYIKK